MTLTFDLVTLTLGQLFCLIIINLLSKYHLDPIIRSRFIGEKHSMLTNIQTQKHISIYIYIYIYKYIYIYLDASHTGPSRAKVKNWFWWFLLVPHDIDRVKIYQYDLYIAIYPHLTYLNFYLTLDWAGRANSEVEI